MLKCSGFPRQGATTPAFGVKSIILQNFCRKLYENERNYTEGGVPGAPWFPGKRSRMVGSPAVKAVYCICVVSFCCGEYVINIWTVACLLPDTNQVTRTVKVIPCWYPRNWTLRPLQIYTLMQRPGAIPWFQVIYNSRLIKWIQEKKTLQINYRLGQRFNPGHLFSCQPLPVLVWDCKWILIHMGDFFQFI